MPLIHLWTALPLAKLEVGHHFYWHIGNLKVHGQVFITTWFVMAILIAAAFAASRNIQRVPSGIQNLMEYALEFIRDLTKSQMGEHEYRAWVPFVGTLFLFILFVTGQAHWYRGNSSNYQKGS